MPDGPRVAVVFEARNVGLAVVADRLAAGWRALAVARSDETLERVRARAPASVRDAWRATKIVGTFVERFPAQLGCVASGADYQVTGTLIA